MLYIRKLIINSKYNLIVVSISSAFINILLNIGLEKFVLSYVISTFSYNLALLKFVNYALIRCSKKKSIIFA